MRISVIVPACNEAPRIARVLATLLAHPTIAEVIVVDDGSTDATSKVAKRAGASIVRHEKNRGKGATMESGVLAARGDIIFFCDADVVGLSHQIIDDILEPVVRGESNMCIGERASKVHSFGFGYTHSMLIDGQRALTRILWESIPREFKSRYQIETALNFFAASSPRGYVFKVFDELSQVRKEDKFGLLRGKLSRYRMYSQIAVARLHLFALYSLPRFVARLSRLPVSPKEDSLAMS